jgi:hypothetical protein
VFGTEAEHFDRRHCSTCLSGLVAFSDFFKILFSIQFFFVFALQKFFHLLQDLPLMLQMGAGSNVRHHLDKLIKEEKVVESNNVLLNTFALAKPKL